MDKLDRLKRIKSIVESRRRENNAIKDKRLAKLSREVIEQEDSLLDLEVHEIEIFDIRDTAMLRPDQVF